MLKRFLKKIDERCSVRMITKVAGVLLIMFLLMETESFWGSWVSMLRAILQPFAIGFGLAYVMHPFVMFLEKKGIPKNFSIIAIWISILVFLVVLLVLLMPIIYDKLNGFMTSMIDGVVWISKKIGLIGNFKDFSLLNNITNSIVTMLESYDNWIPQVMSSIPGVMNTLLNIVTNVLFSIIIAIYMLFDFDRIKRSMKHVIVSFCPKGGHYLQEIDDNVTVYLKSLIILMAIKFVEYSAFYFFIGHPDWFIIGLLTSIGVLVPYLGGTVANGIGIITGLTLAPGRIAALLIGILVLSNIDAYLISPLVHEKRSSLGPLITLLAVFSGGVFLGPVGIMLSVPVTIVVKTCADIYKKDHENDQKEGAS